MAGRARTFWAAFWLALFVLDGASACFLLCRGRFFHGGLTLLLMPAELGLAWDFWRGGRAAVKSTAGRLLAIDDLLRAHGWAVAARPAAGEARWRKLGRELPESQALAQVPAEELQRALGTSHPRHAN